MTANTIVTPELSDELMYVVKSAIWAHPRSQQLEIGPSEIGTPCTRRLGYQAAGVARSNEAEAPWLPTVGTAVHAWLERAFQRVNELMPDGPRFLLEHKVPTGQSAGREVTGQCDVYDTDTETVVDWKIVGAKALKEYKANSPGEQYRAQAHLYGRGWTRRGKNVRHVMIAFLPRNSELRDAYFWSEPYDEQIAVAALQRWETVVGFVQTGGVGTLPLLPTANAHCAYCPWFVPAVTTLTEACPGHPGTVTNPT